MDSLNQLLYLQGIGYDYTSYQGEHIYFSEQARLAALAACGYDTKDDSAIVAANIELDCIPWMQLVGEQLWVKHHQQCFTIKIDNDFNHLTLLWTLYSNDQASAEQIVAQGQSSLAELTEVGHYFYQGKHYSQRKVPLGNDTVAIGYYRLSAQLIDPHFSDKEITAPTDVIDDKQRGGSGELIIYPETVYQPLQEPSWGISAQLYTLSGANNLGIGDFNDLSELIQLSAAQGADYVLLNPLHALFEDDTERASPYSPSDRRCLNPLYIHIQQCPDYSHNKAASHLLSETLAKRKVAGAEPQESATSYINYQTVFNDKYPIYLLLFKSFIDNHAQQKSERYQAFTQFKKQHQQRIACYAQWLVARAKLPQAYRQVEFISYLQWQAQVQLSQCQTLAKTLGMSIGLINDLAVGCHQDGYEYESNQALFANQVSIGAPPDPWAPAGQNWGLPAMDPVKIKRDGLQHFRELIRANMQHCGGLRIDHVMGLLRLWWCINEQSKTQSSCYVYYPLESMLAIVALESQLNHCTVIGEDLGVVPEEIKTALAQAKIYTNNLFYFSKTSAQQFIALEQLPTHTLMMVANHDVATFSAWWSQSDLHLRHSLALFVDDAQFMTAQQQRHQDKENMLIWLRDYQNSDLELSLNSDAELIYQTLVVTLARSPSRLLILQLDDLVGEVAPVNIPGTDQEYPNWRRRLTQDVATIFKENDIFQEINRQRKIAAQ